MKNKSLNQYKYCLVGIRQNNLLDHTVFLILVNQTVAFLSYRKNFRGKAQYYRYTRMYMKLTIMRSG